VWRELEKPGEQVPMAAYLGSAKPLKDLHLKDCCHRHDEPTALEREENNLKGSQEEESAPRDVSNAKITPIHVSNAESALLRINHTRLAWAECSFASGLSDFRVQDDTD